MPLGGHLKVKIDQGDDVLWRKSLVQVLPEGGGVHVDKEDSEKRESCEDPLPETPTLDDVGGVVADFPGAHVHVESPELHRVIGPDDDLGHAEAILLGDGPSRKEDGELQELAMMGEPVGHLEKILTKWEGEAAGMLLLIDDVGLLLIIEEVLDDLERQLVGGGARHGVRLSLSSDTECPRVTVWEIDF